VLVCYLILECDRKLRIFSSLSCLIWLLQELFADDKYLQPTSSVLFDIMGRLLGINDDDSMIL